MKRLVPFLTFLVFSLSVEAYTFKKYQVNDGLSENSVQVIMQDHLGFMWFGSRDGLNRFDGYEYKIYKNRIGDSLSLGNNFIRSIYQDYDHNIWVGTDSHLYLFDYDTEEFHLFSIQSDLGEVIQTGVVTICPENDSTLWVGTVWQGAFCYNKKTKELKQYAKDQDDRVWKIYHDYSGTIWLGTRKGLIRYNRETDNFYTYTTKNTQGTLIDEEIFSIIEDSEGNLWVGTWSGGVARLNKSTNTFESFIGPFHTPYVSHIRDIIEYDQSTLMIGADDGLYFLDKKTGVATRIDNPKDFNSLSNQNVYSICRDHEGGIWLGTLFGGVNYMSPNTHVIEHYYPNLSKYAFSGKAVSQFCEDSLGNLWIATEDGGLNYFNTTTKQFKAYLPEEGKNSLSYHNIHSVVLDEDKLWIGTFSRGVDVLDLKSGKFKNYLYSKDDSTTINDNCISSIYKDSQGDIYIGTSFGLSRYNREQDNFYRIPEVSVFVYDIREDHVGSLWVASYKNGAYRFDYKTETWRSYIHEPGNPKSITFNNLICVYSDEKQRLWFTSEGGGICKYNYETDNFTTFNELNGLPNNIVYSILDDKYGNIWFSSNGGISKMNPVTMDITTYTYEDGLQGNQFNYRSGYKSKEGLFYFGGVNGFNVFNPDNLKNNTHIPPVSITLFEILNDEKPQRVKIADKMKLNHNQASFHISFVSLSFRAQEKNNYKYRMEGLGEKWINIGNQRSVSFINLPPGKYTFHVIGSNNDGIWNEEGDIIEITILPPFWKSNLAQIIYALLFLSIICLLILSYTKKIRQKQLQKLDLYHKEKDKEMYNSKIDFFTNIAHEIRTPVSLIKAPLECIVSSGDGNSETKENLAVIEKNTDHLLELINQLLDFRKIEENSYTLKFAQVNINQLLSSICFRFRPATESKRVNIDLQLPTKEVYATVDKEALTKIISNLLSNALKYATKLIQIELTEDNQSTITFFEIKISDDGIGIADDMKEKIFEPFFQIENNNTFSKKTGTGIGLTLTKQLVNRHNGEIFITNKEGNGTVFVIKIPKQITLQQTTILDKNDLLETEKTSILIVDDNEELRAFLSKSLTKDHHVITAANGKLALDILEKQTVDLVISDIIMPEMDGLELAKSIKQNEQFSHIPVILLSAKTNTQTKVEGLEFGADSYIEKPFSIAILKAQISSLIENRKKILDKFSKSPIIPYGLIAGNKKDKVFLDKLNKEIENNLSDNQFSIEKLAVSMSMSQSNLQKKIKGLSGMVPGDYIRVIKLKKAAELLKSNDYRINEICYLVGFGSPSYFTKCFQKQFGMLPKDFVKGKTQN